MVTNYTAPPIHLTDKLLKQIKYENKAYVREVMCFLMKLFFFLGEETVMTGGGRGMQSLKSLTVWNTSAFCYDNEGRPVEECNSKMCMVALSLWGSPSEWSSEAHDWVMWPDGDTKLSVTPFISQEP